MSFHRERQMLNLKLQAHYARERCLQEFKQTIKKKNFIEKKEKFIELFCNNDATIRQVVMENHITEEKFRATEIIFFYRWKLRISWIEQVSNDEVLVK